MVAHNTDTQGKCPACRAVYRWHGLPLLRDALCPRHETPLRRTTNRKGWPVLRARPGAHECGPLCPEHGDARDTSMDRRNELGADPWPRLKDVARADIRCVVGTREGAACGAPVHARGLCASHYRKWLKYGDPSVINVISHGHRGNNKGAPSSPTYESWSAMKERCLRPKHSHYQWYGGRGITICDRWLGPFGFVNFLADMGERPEGKTLDRIDPDGNYEPANCRWATASEQARNRSPQTHCLRGHEWTEQNTYIRPGTSARMCRECIRIREAKRARVKPLCRCGHRAHGGPCPVDAEDDATERCSCELAVAR